MSDKENEVESVELKSFDCSGSIYNVGDLEFTSGTRCNTYGPSNNCRNVCKIKVRNKNRTYKVQFNMLRVSNYWMSPEQRVEEPPYTLNPTKSLELPYCPIPPECMVILHQTHTYHYLSQRRLRNVENEEDQEEE